MTDFFARVTNATLPVKFDRYWERTIGLPRIYSLDRNGLLFGSTTTTYGADFAGGNLASRPRSVTESQWGIPQSSWPCAVGRLFDGQTLYMINWRKLIGVTMCLAVGNAAVQTPVPLPSGAGRNFLTCLMTGNGRHLLYVTAPPGGSNGSGDGNMWHLCSWTGSAFVLVSSGAIEAPWYEYVGPGSVGQGQSEAAMLESDLTTVWRVSANGGLLSVLRIGADNVLRVVHIFKADQGGSPVVMGDAYPAIYADKGLCAVVSYNNLTIFTSVPLPDDTTAANAPTPFSNSGLRLVQIDNGKFDLAYYDPAVGDAARVETLVYALLFTDAEAPTAREPDRYLRRGWWLDPAAGSSLWHIRRQPLGSAARREAVEAVRGALEAYGLTGVAVTERSPAGVSSVVLEVSGFYRDRQYLVSVPL